MLLESYYRRGYPLQEGVKRGCCVHDKEAANVEDMFIYIFEGFMGKIDLW